MFDFFRNRRRRKLLSSPLSEKWRQITVKNLAVYRLLNVVQQKRMEDAAQIIIAERPFVGCKGQTITDEVKVTIAAQAALLLLGEEGYYFERVPSIIVYPQAYSHRHSLGSSHTVEEEVALLGESWQRGSIVLSWPAVLAGGRDPSDGQNLVLHEFAHHLDGLDGEMGGLPPLPTHGGGETWARVFGREFERHCNDVAAGRDTLLDPYGATNKAEMFAVATECFFEQPIAMRERHAELFEQFRAFYKVDPTNWFDQGPDAQLTVRKKQAPPPADEEEDEAAPSDNRNQPQLATADQYFTRGHDHFLDGQFDLAEADFDRAVKLDPRDQEALVYRAEARFSLGHWEAALADAERACQLDEGDLEARRVRGMARVALENYTDGVADLDAALGTNSDDLDGLFYRGLARAQTGQFQAAIHDLTRVIELDPDDAEAYSERGHCFEAIGNSQAAQTDSQNAERLGISSEQE